MRVFVSWSGERSAALAKVLREWLPHVLQAVHPWYSSDDIQKGSAWAAEIAGQLKTTDFGIICVTPESQLSPWLLFEAGALSAGMSRTAVATVLLDMTPAEVIWPLAQYQSTLLNYEDVLRLLTTLNNYLETPLSEKSLHAAFDRWCPELEQGATNACRIFPGATIHRRADRDILEEILNELRLWEHRELSAVSPASMAAPRWFENYLFSRDRPADAGQVTSTVAVKWDSLNSAKYSLSDVACPIHYQPIKISSAPTLDSFEIITVYACCQFALSLAQERVKSWAEIS